MKILKQGNSVKDIAQKRIKREEQRDEQRFNVSVKRKKAMQVLAERGLDKDLHNKSGVELSPYEIEARKIYSKNVHGKLFTPRFLSDGINSYFKSIDDRQTTLISNSGRSTSLSMRRPYTLEGLCNHLGVTKKQFMSFTAEEKNPELYVLATMACQKIVEKLLDLGLSKEIDASLTKFYLKNVSDLKETTDVEKSKQIGNITFVTVSSREEYKQLKESGKLPDGAIIDVPAEDIT